MVFYKKDIYEYSYFSMIYYVVCLTIFFIPFLRFSGTSQSFSFPKQSVNILSYILIWLGTIALFFELKDFSLSELMTNWLAVRSEYYSDYGNFEIATTLSERIASNIKPWLFLCWPMAMYQLSKRQNRILGILLIIVSSSSLISSLKIAERQGILLYIGNVLFSYLIFKNDFSKSIRNKILLISAIILGLSITLIGAISFSRFGEDSDTLISSLVDYSGIQPFNAAYFLEKLHNQALGGRLNFPFLTRTPMILQINDEISAAEYLNVFGSIVGSYYLDFGYFTVFVIIFVAILFYRLMNIFKRKGSLLFFYFYCLYFNIMFIGVFYNKYNSPPEIRNLILLGVIIWCTEKISQAQNSY